MRTTLVIPDQVMARVREEADRQGSNLSQWVTDALAVRLAQTAADEPNRPQAFVLKPVDMGVPLVDVADRDALDRAMGDEPW